MKKSKFFIYFWALFPGAGHMYLGQMKKGLLFALLFWGDIGLATFLYLSPLLILLPVIWFYALFDVLNLAGMSPEQRKIQEEHSLAELAHFFAGKSTQKLFEKRAVFFGVGLMLLGAYLLLRSFFYPLLYSLAESYPSLYNLIYDLPTIFVAALLLFFGIKVLRGKKPAIDDSEDIKEYGEDSHG